MEHIDVVSMNRAHASLDEIRQRRTARLQVERKHAKHLAQAVGCGGGGGGGGGGDADDDDGWHNSETASCSGSSMDSVRSARSTMSENANVSSRLVPPPMALDRSMSASTASFDSQTTRVNGTASRKRPSSAPASQFTKRQTTPHSPHSRRSELLIDTGYESCENDVGGQVFRMTAGPKFPTRSVPWA